MKHAFVVVAHNAEKYILRLASLENAFFLTDGSTDSTEELCGKFGLTYRGGTRTQSPLDGFNEALEWATELSPDTVTILGKDDLPTAYFKDAIATAKGITTVGCGYFNTKKKHLGFMKPFGTYLTFDGTYHPVTHSLVEKAINKTNNLGTPSCWILPREIYSTFRFTEPPAHRLDLEMFATYIDKYPINYYNQFCMIIEVSPTSLTGMGFTPEIHRIRSTHVLRKMMER